MLPSAPVRQTRRRTERWRALLVLALLGAGILGYEASSETGYLARREQQNQIQKLARDIDELQMENERLGQDIRSLRSDPGAIEEMAREQLRLALPGEIIVPLPSKPDR